MMFFNKLLKKIFKKKQNISYHTEVCSKEEQDNLLLKSLIQNKSFNSISLPWEINNSPNRMLIPYILCAQNFYLLSTATDYDIDIEFYCLWGSTSNSYTKNIENISRKKHRPLVRLEYGFISSYDIALNDSFQYSLLLSGNDIYYNATKNIHRKLLESNFIVSEDNITRSRNIIKYITTHGVTKYTLTLRTLTAKKNNKKILIIDQRKGDKSIALSNASDMNFKKMIEYALSLTDYEIIVKIHPDATFGGKESSLINLISETEKRITIIDNNENPYTLFDMVEKVFVVCSQIGFEALMAGKEVHCFGEAFYSGYGLTIDHDIPPKKRKRSVEEIFYVYYILFSKYYIPGIGHAQIEDLCRYIVFLKKNNIRPQCLGNMSNIFKSIENKQQAANKKINLKICFVIAGGRWGATGRYIQYLAWYMQKKGADIFVLCEGQCKNNYSGVKWRQIKFDNYFLSQKIKQEINEFNPDIIYENGVRTIPQRAALELKIANSNAKLVVQNEDDDLQIFQEKYNLRDLESIIMLDKKDISIKDICIFLEKNNWEKTINILMDPSFDRWIDPILRIIFYRMADLHTAIWYPLADYISTTFNKKTIIVPPVLPFDRFCKMESHETKESWLNKYGISQNDTNIFLPGTIYSYSNEFKIFIDAINMISNIRIHYNIFLMTKGNEMACKEIKRLVNKNFKIIDLGRPSDEEYNNCLYFSDIICCPGVNDRFNKMRLPSRLVKPMMLGKVIITYRSGLGESLTDDYNCYLLQGDTAIEWAKTLEHALTDTEHHVYIGENARTFAKNNFDAQMVSDKLIKEFLTLKETNNK